MRVHCYRNGSRYISAALILRSKEIGAHGGLAHILEHTSFTGAAGNMTASELKQKRRALIQDSNAMTSPGKLEWYASFLPKYASEALQLLAVTSLDQKFDLKPSERGSGVLEELLLDKYSSEGASGGGSIPSSTERTILMGRIRSTRSWLLPECLPASWRRSYDATRT